MEIKIEKERFNSNNYTSLGIDELEIDKLVDALKTAYTTRNKLGKAILNSEVLRLYSEGIYKLKDEEEDVFEEFETAFWENWPNFDEKEIERPKPYELSVYVNTSDSLLVLNKIEGIEGKTVTTIAGSGDFIQIFIYKGALRINVVDISLPALFFNELKLEGLRHLTFAEYRQMFSNWRNYKADSELQPIFDKTLYQKIKPYLSKEAQHFFGKLTLEENEALMQFDGDAEISFLRSRKLMKSGKSINECTEVFVDDLVEEDSYEDLQIKAKNAEVSFKKSDFLDHIEANSNTNEIVYLSNAYYLPNGLTERSVRALTASPLNDIERRVLDLVERGVRVVFTVGNNLDQRHLNPSTEKRNIANILGSDGRYSYGTVVDVNLKI